MIAQSEMYTYVLNPKIGDKVRYVPFEDCPEDQWEKGRVKSIPEDPDHVFVVYHCSGEWDTGWKNYTAARTRKIDLINGW